MEKKTDKKRILEYVKKLWHKPLLFSLVAAFITVIFAECLGRHSFLGGFEFLFLQPVYFLVNMLPVAALFSLTYLLKKRVFAQIMVAFVIAVFSIVNFVLLFTRINPLEAMDFSIIRTGISIIHVYLNTFEIILCAIAIIIAIGLLIFAAVKTPKVRVDYKKSAIIGSGLTLASVALITSLTLSGFIPATFKDTIKANDQCGFLYCFTRSVFDRGISEPDDYNPESIDTLLEKLHKEETKKPDSLPNIIMIQLESFMDPSAFVDAKFDKDPIPVFTKLKEECTSGILYVPSVGSGTANTEFEVLTGMNLDHFGMGEYPYKTVLQDKTCETICYNLSSYGYTSHAFHNHTGTFYDRNIVYESLGFSTFTPIEYMHSYEVNPLGWAKDYVLESEIMSALKSTAEQDFVFAVSVQGHGKYPSVPVEGEGLIDVEGDFDEELAHQLSYYAYQLNEMDRFLGMLIEELEAFDEECVLVLYGDHQPSIEYDEEDIVFGDKHCSEYVIWANFEMDKKDEDIESYQLSAYALELLGMDSGILTKLHQCFRTSENYDEYLELLEYDALYGEMLSYGGKNIFKPCDMTMGIDSITVDSISCINNNYYIIGRNFTQSSTAFVNDDEIETIYISPTVLLCIDYIPEENDVFSVKQITNDSVILGETKPFVFIFPESQPVFNPDLIVD